jgi:peptidyl-prolyl cis-trans isomerase B (cyclophilin B)
MPTNEQRRATAKLRFEQHLERETRKARRRRIRTIVGSSVAGIAAIAAVTVSISLADRGDSHTAAAAAASSHASGPLAGVPPLPPFKPAAELGTNCEYPPAPEPASKPVEAPRSGKVPTDPAQVEVSLVTDRGRIGLVLANNESPCAVTSFTSLAKQRFFDDTPCHRLTTSPTLGVLQCGDPKGDGTGGPGYRFANEYPTDEYQPDDPKSHQPVVYPRGTVAVANTGEGTNGSQFFLVYKDSRLPPEFPVLGKIDAAGLVTLDEIARAGVVNGGQDGPPVTNVTIKSVRLG